MAAKFTISDTMFTKIFFILVFVSCLYISFTITKRTKIVDIKLPVDSLSKTKPLVTPSFPVKKKVGMYTLKMSIKPHMPHFNGNYIYLITEMYDSDDQRINEFEHEYWWETGRDSDGTWTEKEESESWTFKNHQKNDSLYLEIYGDKRLSNTRYYKAKHIKVEVWEDPQASIGNTFLIAGIIFLVLFFMLIFA